MKNKYIHSLQTLDRYIVSKDYRGYDPYDILLSSINFGRLGKWGPAIAIQVQKRNPLNLRKAIGIKSGINPKAMGLLLKAHSILYRQSGSEEHLKKANYIFKWLTENHSTGYAGKCWGYNFPWASTTGFLPANTPSVVVTSFVIDGVFEYFKVTNSELAKETIISSAKYISNNIPITTYNDGISYAYTHLSKGDCYNASLLACEVLAKADTISSQSQHQRNIHSAIDFVLSKQKSSGEWWYSINDETGYERKQIDFHQGFVLVSLHNLNDILTTERDDIRLSIDLGLQYYRENQFTRTGRSYWRIPKKWPTDIHHQAQGIITFSKLQQYQSSDLQFALTIADWTIKNMQSSEGYFYYRKNPVFVNKIPYIRWGQAWMMLALTELLQNGET